MSLFDTTVLESSRRRSSRVRESLYNFVLHGSSDGPSIAHHWLNNAFDQLHTEAQESILPRLKAANWKNAMGAFFELIAFGVMRNDGTDARLVPESTQSTADIEIPKSQGTPITIECGLIQQNDNQTKDDDREFRFSQEVARLVGPTTWMLNINKTTKGPGTPSAKSFARTLQTQAANHNSGIYKWRCAKSGWSISYEFIDSLTKMTRDSIIGIGETKAYWENIDYTKNKLYTKLKDKLKQHNYQSVPCISCQDFQHHPQAEEIVSTAKRLNIQAMIWVTPAYPWNCNEVKATLLTNMECDIKDLWRGARQQINTS